MVRLVMTVKLGINRASISIRNVQMSQVRSATIVGSSEFIGEFLKTLEANPEVKVKFE
jgi:hypothetical protein